MYVIECLQTKSSNRPLRIRILVKEEESIMTGWHIPLMTEIRLMIVAY